jgi:vacuolar-type H+-ATPase subunit E/Vma4
MKSVDESIETLSRAILSEANAEAEQIKNDARARADAIRQQAEKQAAAERAEILERAEQEAERIRSQVVATSQLKARTRQLEHREKLLQNVFDSARQQLPSVEEWSDYEEIALSLLREAVVQLRSQQAVVRADKAMVKLLANGVLEKISKELNVPLTLGDTLEKGTGVVVETPDGHINYDNTLETRLARLQNSLRSPVHHILMGESL